MVILKTWTPENQSWKAPLEVIKSVALHQGRISSIYVMYLSSWEIFYNCFFKTFSDTDPATTPSNPVRLSDSFLSVWMSSWLVDKESRLLFSFLLAAFQIFEDSFPGVPQTILNVATPHCSTFSHLLWAFSNFCASCFNSDTQICTVHQWWAEYRTVIHWLYLLWSQYMFIRYNIAYLWK